MSPGATSRSSRGRMEIANRAQQAAHSASRSAKVLATPGDSASDCAADRARIARWRRAGRHWRRCARPARRARSGFRSRGSRRCLALRRARRFASLASRMPLLASQTSASPSGSRPAEMNSRQLGSGRQLAESRCAAAPHAARTGRTGLSKLSEQIEEIGGHVLAQRVVVDRAEGAADCAASRLSFFSARARRSWREHDRFRLCDFRPFCCHSTSRPPTCEGTHAQIQTERDTHRLFGAMEVGFHDLSSALPRRQSLRMIMADQERNQIATALFQSRRMQLGGLRSSITDLSHRAQTCL